MVDFPQVSAYFDTSKKIRTLLESGEETMSKKILIVTGDGGETYEVLFAVHRFTEAGYKPVVAAPSKRRLNLVIHDMEPGWDTYKERPGYFWNADIAFDNVNPADYVAVLCIGGRGPEYLRNNAKLISILKEMDKLGKWHFSICHGLQLTAAADLVRGKTLTSYGHIQHEVRTMGGNWVDRKAVRDGRLVSARTWYDHPWFYQEVFKCLAEKS
jgi:protease I